MPVPFSRSLRSLNTDNYRPSLVLLLLASGLIVLWLLWFFFAPIAIYVNTETLQIREEGYLRVTVSEEDFGRVQRGNIALITLTGDAAREVGTVEALVIEKRADVGNPFIDLYAPLHIEALEDYENTSGGSARIEVENASPFVMMMQISGQFIDGEPLRTSGGDGEQFRAQNS